MGKTVVTYQCTGDRGDTSAMVSKGARWVCCAGVIGAGEFAAQSVTQGFSIKLWRTSGNT